jgi:feruloyl esterase
MASYKMYSIALLSLSYLHNRSQTLSSDDFRTKCLNFKPTIPNANLELVEYLERGTSAHLPYRHVTCGGPGHSAKLADDVCRVAVQIHTSKRSFIHFEGWFPKTFNNRFLVAGNGGLNGCR